MPSAWRMGQSLARAHRESALPEIGSRAPARRGPREQRRLGRLGRAASEPAPTTASVRCPHASPKSPAWSPTAE
jgi:hypothetical protein